MNIYIISADIHYISAKNTHINFHLICSHCYLNHYKSKCNKTQHQNLFTTYHLSDKLKHSTAAVAKDTRQTPLVTL